MTPGSSLRNSGAEPVAALQKEREQDVGISVYLLDKAGGGSGNIGSK
jgi:hypothetical protein